MRAGVVGPDCLRAALCEQRRCGRRLGHALMEMGALSEKDLVRALALLPGTSASSQHNSA